MAYLVVLSIFILLAFASLRPEKWISVLNRKGQNLGFSLLYAQLFLVLILAPAYAASAIAIEKNGEKLSG